MEGNQGPIRSLIHQTDRILILSMCFLLFHPVYFLNYPINEEPITSLGEITHSLLKISHQENFNSSQPTLSLFLILRYCSQQPFVACFSGHSPACILHARMHPPVSFSCVNDIQHLHPFQTHLGPAI